MTDEKRNTVPENPKAKPKNEVKHEINSISDLIEILGNKEAENKETKQKKIKGLGKPEPGKTRFFRGHANEGWQMLPSIYRAKHLIENEDKIIKDALTYCPDDFSPSDTLFEKLVKLQHYGYSTRLLDLTTNALVALYFASLPYINPDTKEEELKDGELIILDIPDTEIKYGDSDTVAILSAISLQGNAFTIRKKGLKKLYDKTIIKEMGDSTLRISTLFPTNISPFLVKYNKFESENKNRKTIDDLLLNFNSQLHIIKLLQDIRTDKPHFRPVINPGDFNRVLCVRAKLNNQRISRQQGCFLLFGIGDSKTEPAAIPDEWQRLASNNQKILVKAKRKADIKKELESFGISKRTLFPELEAQAKEIMEQYNPDSKKP